MAKMGGLSGSERQALTTLVFESMSREPRRKLTAYVKLNEVLGVYGTSPRAARHIQEVMGRALGVEGFIRLHACIISKDRGLRTAAARLFCRLLNNCAANVQLVDRVGIGGGNLNGIRLVAVGSAYQQAYRNEHGAGAASSSAPEDGDSDGDGTSHGASGAEAEASPSVPTLASASTATAPSTGAEASEQAAFRLYLERLTADTAQADRVGPDGAPVPQLSFWSHVLPAGEHVDAAVFPDPVCAAVGYYMPLRRGAAPRSASRGPASPTGHRPRTAPSLSPSRLRPPTHNRPSSSRSSRASAASGQPARDVVPPSPPHFDVDSDTRGDGCGFNARPTSAPAPPAPSGLPKHELVQEVAALQRRCRLLEAEAAAVADRRRSSSPRRSVTAQSDGMSPTRPSRSAVAAKLQDQLTATKALLQARAQELAAIDRRLAPVDTGSLSEAVEAERQRQRQRLVAHDHKVRRVRKEDDTLLLKRAEEVMKKDAKEKARREYMKRFYQQERAAARMKAIESQRKAEERQRREAAKAALRAQRYQMKAAETERRKKAMLAAQRRAAAEARRERDEARRQRVLNWARQQQEEAEERHRAVAEAKLSQVIDSPAERGLRAKAYGRLVAQRNLEQLSVRPAAPARWGGRGSRPGSAPSRPQRQLVAPYR